MNMVLHTPTPGPRPHCHGGRHHGKEQRGTVMGQLTVNWRSFFHSRPKSKSGPGEQRHKQALPSQAESSVSPGQTIQLQKCSGYVARPGGGGSLVQPLASVTVKDPSLVRLRRPK